MKTTRYFRKVLLTLCSLCVGVLAMAQEAALKEAETAYTSEDYAKAIALYEEVLSSHGESAAVYYNLGNAYYKAGKLGPAILNYERCLLLQPGDADARFNLQMARQKTIDKIACLVLFFFARWTYLKKIGFYLGLLFLALVIVSNLFANYQKGEWETRSHAIVFAATVTAKSSPDASGTDLFVLHEGTYVSIKSTLGAWSEIELEDGNVGWLPTKDIETI